MSEEPTGGSDLGDVDDVRAQALEQELGSTAQQPDHPYDPDGDPDGGHGQDATGDLGDEARG